MASDDNDSALTSGDSTAAAAIYTSLFALLLLSHVALFVGRCLRSHRPAWFCLPFIVGGMMETTGFTTRTLSTRTPPTTALKAVQALTILLAPVVFAAAIYMTLSRIMAFYKTKPSSPSSPPPAAATSKTNANTKPPPPSPSSRHRSHCNPRTWRVTPVFVTGDALCFLVQAIGAGTVAAGGGAKLGGDIILGGLALQIAVFGVFVGVAGRVHLGLKKREWEEMGDEGGQHWEGREPGGKGGRGWKLKTMCNAWIEARGWEGQMVGLYVMSGAVMGRNVYRVVEYILGVDGYLMQHEWPLYVLDASMMVVVMSVGLRCYALQTTVATKEKAGVDGDRLLLRGSSGEGYDLGS